MKPSSDGWEELADWYDQKEGETGDLWHRALIDPVLLRVLGQCRGKRVLDLGCGNGYLARRIARLGATVTAVDASPRMIRNAKSRDDGSGVRYLRASATMMRGVGSASFDVVFANMSLMDVEDAEAAIGEVARVLRKGGRFVASISHPCFNILSNSSWTAEKTMGNKPVVHRKVRGYRTPFAERVPWDKEDGSKPLTMCYHRPLNWYARALSSNGLAITALEEPGPTPEFTKNVQEKPGDMDGAGFQEVPLHLVIEAVRI
ncbi:MAG: methyltransferase domain-containing protein [Nitrososphaerota archaeon]|nr:methyltransferase domain-containing protein [Nitrososphaerota archaeon]